MKKLIRSQSYLIFGLICFGFASHLSAAVIFGNTTSDELVRFNPGTLEVGDEIILSGPERYLTNFSFEFWGTNTASPGNIAFAGDVEARVRFYRNNGPLFHGYPSPGDKFYDSDWFSLSPTPRSVATFTHGADFPWPGLYMPVTSNMTWSVQFRGMAPTDTVGVDLYSPSEIGQDYPDYWENNGTSWVLKTNSAVAAVDFAARFEASGQPYVNLSPPYLTSEVSEGTQTLSWPEDHTGWKLQAQTNSFGIGTNWYDIHDSTTTNVCVLPIDPNNSAVFYRLISP